MNLYNLINVAHEAFHFAKTQTFYRAIFGRIGKRTIIRSPILITHPEFIQCGSRVSIRNGARLEVVSLGGAAPLLSIGDNTLIEQDVHIVCHNRVKIGKNVSITARCAIVDTTHPIADRTWEGNIGHHIQEDQAEVTLEDGVFLGMGTVVLPNVTIGKGAVIGANSVVAFDIPEFAIASGSPAKVIQFRSEG